MELKDVKWAMLSETPVEYNGTRYIITGCNLRLGRNSRTPVVEELYYTLTLKDLNAVNSYIDVGIESVMLKDRLNAGMAENGF